MAIEFGSRKETFENFKVYETTLAGRPFKVEMGLLVAGGGQRLLRLLTNVLEACKRTSIPVKSGRIQTRHSRKGEIAARHLVS